MLWRCARAKVLAGRGEHEAAEKLSAEAETLTEPTEFPDLQASVRISRARVLTVTGREDEARRCLERELEIYRQKGNVVAARNGAKLFAPSSG